MQRTSASLTALAAALLALAGATPLRAQSGVHFNIGAGASLPNGTFGDRNDIGYNLVVGLEMPQTGSPLGFRVEGQFNEFSVSNLGDRKSRASGVTANATYDLNQPRRGNTPGNTIYLIGGLGYYSTRNAFFTNNTDSNIGFNVGGGFRFPLTGFSAYIEARYNTVSNTDVRFTPITFGLVF